jgi:hypothetical protein
LRSHENIDPMKNAILILFFAIASICELYASRSNDSIPTFSLEEISVYTQYPFTSDKEKKAYKQMEDDLRKVFPLVRLVREEYERVNKEMHLYDDKRRKAYLKWYEGYARENYMPLLSGFTVSQGRLFLKMIDRELGQSPYQLIKIYRNGFRALFWQGTAFLFRSNLNADYKPEENPMIEHILRKIKAEQDTSIVFDTIPGDNL